MEMKYGSVHLTREQLENLYINAAQFYTGEDVSGEVDNMRVLDIRVNLRRVLKLAEKLGDWEVSAMIGALLSDHLMNLGGAVTRNGKIYYWFPATEEWTIYEDNNGRRGRWLVEESKKKNNQARWDAQFLKVWLNAR